jgi:hypothetical protein
MESAEAPQLFPVPYGRKAQRAENRCLDVGPLSARRGVLLRRVAYPPKCNRFAGHTGPHRVYRTRDFMVMAEWERR